MTHQHVKMRAVHQYMAWEDEDDTEPIRWADWCDPLNEFVHWSTSRPDEDRPEHAEGEPVEVEIDIFHAAMIVADWPGEVWDFCEGEWDTINYREGVSHMSTLFVDGDATLTVFNIAAEISATRDQRLREMHR